MSRVPGKVLAVTGPGCAISASRVKVRGKKKHKQNDPLAAFLETAPKAKLVDLIVRVTASHPAVRHECLDYLTRHTALSHSQKKQSEGEKLLALWAELAPDLDELEAYGGGDYDADFHVSSLLQEIAQTLSRKKTEAAYRQQLLDKVLPYIERQMKVGRFLRQFTRVEALRC